MALSAPAPGDGGFASARELVDQLRHQIERRYTNPALRESSWRFFLAQAGDWATDDGLRRAGAYEALRPIYDRVVGNLAQRTLTNIRPVAARPRR